MFRKFGREPYEEYLTAQSMQRAGIAKLHHSTVISTLPLCALNSGAYMQRISAIPV